MKKISTLAGFCFLIIVTSCNTTRNSQTGDVAQSDKSNISGNYLGSFYKGNYVWGGAMNLAWNELNENILHEKLHLRSNDAKALDMVEKLNKSPFSKNDLDEGSYYVKSGYGQGTVEQINRESREKFPKKSFADLNLKLKPMDIISYAYFLKEVEYKTMFDKKDITFNGQKVKGFAAGNKEQKKNVKIIKYDNDNKFIIKLRLNDNSDELILAKGYDMSGPQAIVDSINSNNRESLPSIGGSDEFAAPKIHLDYHRDYVELVNKFLSNKGFEKYFISDMFENIKFDMDEKGAKVENEAVIAVRLTAIIEKEEPKNFILDKPYWIVMKRAGSGNPYFILGVNNSGLLENSVTQGDISP